MPSNLQPLLTPTTQHVHFLFTLDIPKIFTQKLMLFLIHIHNGLKVEQQLQRVR
jgi:hypothetical protein